MGGIFKDNCGILFFIILFLLLLQETITDKKIDSIRRKEVPLCPITTYWRCKKKYLQRRLRYIVLYISILIVRG